jgi:hypothetical protein
MDLRGNVEVLTRSEIRGWAVDVDQPAAPVTVELVVNGRVVATARADEPRPDLALLGLGQGFFGFVLAVPAGTPLDLNLAQVRVAGIGTQLTGLREAARYEGVLEQISGTLITGWAWHSWLPLERVTVLVRDSQRIIGSVTADRARPDLLNVNMGDGRYGFEFELRVLPDWHRIDTSALLCTFEPTGDPLHDMRPGKARAPVSLTASRNFYSAKGPASVTPASAGVQVPTPTTLPPGLVSRPPVPPAQPAAAAAVAPAPAQPAAAAPEPSNWRTRRPQRPVNRPAAVQLVRVVQAPPAEKPLSPELLAAMRESLNFGEDDPF